MLKKEWYCPYCDSFTELAYVVEKPLCLRKQGTCAQPLVPRFRESQEPPDPDAVWFEVEKILKGL